MCYLRRRGLYLVHVITVRANPLFMLVVSTPAFYIEVPPTACTPQIHLIKTPLHFIRFKGPFFRSKGQLLIQQPSFNLLQERCFQL